MSEIDPAEIPDLKLGLKVIRTELKTLGNEPGVYRMLNANQEVLYVGKAKNLKKRVVSYTRPTGHTKRITKMIALTRSMIFITTHTEAEALLLEATLIKKLKPRYNVLLRDDRSFPYIFLRDHHWPQITKHRGAKKEGGKYFGPFASAAAVGRTLNTLQRVFLLRNCSDSVLNNRTRPCMQYQIKRCSAPCVNFISKDDYDQLVKEAADFLSGKSSGIQKRLASQMQAASDALEYEAAAAIRDRLRALTLVQTQQNINATNIGNADVIAAYQEGGQTSIQVFFYRAGQNWGNRSYFPRHEKGESIKAIMGAFIGQFYDNKPAPANIFVSDEPEAKKLIEEALATRVGHGVKILVPKKGGKKTLMADAIKNAQIALGRKVAEAANQSHLLQSLQALFGLDEMPQRVEVYDNSHVSGTNAVGAMIVTGPEGLMKNAYRKFNIKSENLTPGDDFGMMREVMTRRFSRLIKEVPDRNDTAHWPHLLLIDGGRGQLTAVHEILSEFGVADIPLVAISKGPDRNAGREQFHMMDRKTFSLERGDKSLFFLQRLRDEAHRFAIGAHRTKRKATAHTSALDKIPGIGPSRKRALLNHFGSAKAVEGAGQKDLESVEGISAKFAEVIYNYFHEE